MPSWTRSIAPAFELAKLAIQLALLVALIIVLAGCGNRLGREPGIRIQTAPVAIAVGCVRSRPAPVVALKRRVSEAEWAARAPGARARSIEVQAGLRMNRDDLLTAATAACPDASLP